MLAGCEPARDMRTVTLSDDVPVSGSVFEANVSAMICGGATSGADPLVNEFDTIDICELRRNELSG